jgi:hypothetical protein
VTSDLPRGGGVFSIPLDQLNFDAARQARDRPFAPVIDDYTRTLESDPKFGFPALDAFCDGQAVYVWDDGHRGQAYQDAGRKAATVNAAPGTKRDALLAAAGANADHGHRRTSADKRAAVMICLNDEKCRDSSNREIANLCCVGETLVRRLRAEVGAVKPQMERKAKRNGKEYTIRTAGINAGRRIAPEALKLLRDTPWMDSVPHIEKLGTYPPEKQRAVAQVLAANEAAASRRPRLWWTAAAGSSARSRRPGRPRPSPPTPAKSSSGTAQGNGQTPARTLSPGARGPAL